MIVQARIRTVRPTRIKPRLKPSHPLNRGLAAHYVMSGLAGSTLYDISGNDNHGALENGATWVKVNGFRTINFDGVDDGVRALGTAESLKIGGTNITVCAWLYRTANSGSSGGRVVAKDANYELVCRYDGVSELNSLRFHIAGNFVTSTTDIIPLRIWTFATCTYDGANIRFYVNGELTKTAAAIGTISTSNTDLTLARPSTLPTNTSFPGSLDDVRIFNRTLSAQEIRELYTNPWQTISANDHFYPVANGVISPGGGLPIALRLLTGSFD